MEFSQEEIEELSEFFAKRFPESYSRIRIANEAGVLHVETESLSAEEGWAKLLRNTQESGGLARLAVSADKLVPDDELLHEVSAIIAGYRSSSAPRMTRQGSNKRVRLGAMGAGGLVGCMVLALVAWNIRGTSDETQVQVTVNDATIAQELDAVALAAPLENEPTVVASEDKDLAPVASEPVVEKAEPVEPVKKSVVATAEQPKIRRANDNGRCTLSEGGLVGYWYAGSSVSAAVGDSITMEHAVNVRIDYPDKHNSFDKRTPIRCTLYSGDLVKLSQEPLLVPGDRYWVPLHSGDLIQNGEDAAASASAMR